MKTLSKRMLSIVLALVMAMPVMLALPGAASANASDGTPKILEWDFVGSSKPSFTMTNTKEEEYRGYANASYGTNTLSLINYYSSNNWAYDGNNGIKSDNGIVWIEDLGSSLVANKDIDIQFTLATRGNIGDSNWGVFAIGSAYADEEGDSAVNNFLSLDNNGGLKYNYTSINTSASAKPVSGNFYNYRIYFDYNAKRVDIYRNNVLIGTKQDNDISIDNFKCIVFGTNITKKWTKNSIKKITISQYDPSNKSDMDDLCSASSVAASNIKSFSAKAYHVNAEADSNYYGNLVYCPANTTNFTGKSDKTGTDVSPYEFDRKRVRIMSPANVIGVYDGHNANPSFPMIFENKITGSNPVEYFVFLQPYATSDSEWNNRKFTFRYLWTGYSSGNRDNWPVVETSDNFDSQAKVQKSRSDVPADWKDGNNSYDNVPLNDRGYTDTHTSHQTNTSTSRYWMNSAQYNGSGDTTNYYEKISDFKLLLANYAQGARTKVTFWWVGGEGKVYYVTPKATTNFYVLNYEPIYNILKSSSPTTVTVNGTARNIRELRNYFISGEGSWMYTKASKAEALRRLAAVGDVDPNAYGYSDISADVAACAAEIKSAYENFISIPSILVKDTFKVSFTRTDGVSVPDRSITAGDPLGALPDNSSNAVADSTHHNVYTWEGILPTTVVHSSMAYSETANSTPCEFEDGDVVAATGSHNGYTVKECSGCSNEYNVYNALNWTEYNSVLSDYNTKTTNNKYTTSTVNSCIEAAAAYTHLNDTDNTPQNTPQSTINTAAGVIDTAVKALEGRASFLALDAAKQAHENFVLNHDSEYTTSSKTAFATYLNDTDEFPLENDADRANTGVSQNGDIELETAKYEAINRATYLDPVADISSLEDAYAEGDELLNSLAGKAAQYDSTSVSALVTAVEAANASKFIGATAEEKADFGTKGENSDQNAADALAENITDAIAGLTIAEIKDGEVTVDTSAFEAAVNALNNLDPDAYEEDELHSLANAKDTINDYYGTAKVEYGDDYINVVNGITTQAKAEEATGVILGALNSCIKRYAVTRNGFSNYGIKNGTEKNGGINYGATLTCDSGSAETAWFIEIETSSMHKYLAFQKYGRELETKILGRTVVNAVKRDATNNCRIMITRSYGDERAPVQYANFVANGTEFELPSAPSVAYYHFEGYKYKNGANINTSTITINGDTEIVAVYSQNNTLSCSVNAKDINEITIPTDSVAYNEKVVLDGGEGTYGWLEKIGTTYRPFYIGRKVSFFATESIVLEAVDEETFNSYGSIPCVNLRQSGVVTADSKKVFNAQLVPGDADVREYGILIAAPSSKGGAEARTPLDSEIIIENSGQQAGYAILRAKSTKLVGANQFSIVVSGALPEGYKYRGYVIYQYKGALQTAYSEVMYN